MIANQLLRTKIALRTLATTAAAWLMAYVASWALLGPSTTGIALGWTSLDMWSRRLHQ